MKLLSIALLYQKTEGNKTTNNVRSYISENAHLKDEFDCKAEAERYFANDKNLVGSNIVAWHIMGCTSE